MAPSYMKYTAILEGTVADPCAVRIHSSGFLIKESKQEAE